MKAEPLELEGTWEEIVARGEELAGRRVRVIVLPSEAEGEDQKEEEKRSTARSLLKYAGTWEGDDLQELLQLVQDTRSQAKL